MTDLPRLDIRCGDTDCDNGRHAFNERDYKQLGKGRNYVQAGVCRCCGSNNVDFVRTHARDVNDIDYLFGALPFELIRHEFWNRPFNDASMAKARELGRAKTYAGVHERLAKAVGPVGESGWSFTMVPTHQDKMKDVIQYAQHAIAACCRRCIHTWHGIPNERPLTLDQIGYLQALVVRYLDIRLPNDLPS